MRSQWTVVISHLELKYENKNMVMSLYFLSPQATQDLQEINDYLFAGNADIADRFLTIITQKFEILAQFPAKKL